MRARLCPVSAYPFASNTSPAPGARPTVRLICSMGLAATLGRSRSPRPTSTKSTLRAPSSPMSERRTRRRDWYSVQVVPIRLKRAACLKWACCFNRRLSDRVPVSAQLRASLRSAPAKPPEEQLENTNSRSSCFTDAKPAQQSVGAELTFPGKRRDLGQPLPGFAPLALALSA